MGTQEYAKMFGLKIKSKQKWSRYVVVFTCKLLRVILYNIQLQNWLSFLCIQIFGFDFDFDLIIEGSKR